MPTHSRPIRLAVEETEEETERLMADSPGLIAENIKLKHLLSEAMNHCPENWFTIENGVPSCGACRTELYDGQCVNQDCWAKLARAELAK